MSHFPAGQVQSDVPLYPAGQATQKLALDTGNAMYDVYSAKVTMFPTGDTLLFTTDANRGRFFPIFIGITAVFGSRAVTSTPPNVFIGWQNPGRSNAYDNWLSNEGLQAIYDNAGQRFGAGYYDKTTLTGPSWSAFLSAPPSTPIYMRVAGTNTSTDLRVVTIVGLYTG